MERAFLLCSLDHTRAQRQISQQELYLESRGRGGWSDKASYDEGVTGHDSQDETFHFPHRLGELLTTKNLIKECILKKDFTQGQWNGTPNGTQDVEDQGFS